MSERSTTNEPVTTEVLITRDPAHQTTTYAMKDPSGIGECIHTLTPDGDEWLLRFNNGGVTAKRHYPTTEAAVTAVVHSFMPELRPPGH